MKYIKLYIELIKQSLIRAMAYRINFIAVLFTNFAYFMVQIIFMDVIFLQIDTLVGWTKYEVFFYIGTFAIIDALWVFGPFFNLRGLPDLIRTGGFDAYLLKPVNSQFFTSLRKIDVGSIMSAFTGVGMVIYAIIKGKLTVTFFGVIFYIVAIFLALLVEYSVYLMLVCLAFSMMRVDFAEIFHGIICYFANKPIDIYRGFIRKLLITIFPYGLLMTIATKTALSKITIREYMYGVFLSFLFLFLSTRCWKISIKKYSSASS